MVGLIAAIALPAARPLAQERSITEIDPAVIQQGDTVLLTIKGENLPVGTVALEFFPQQIALLDILSASDTEVVAQVKVPSLVTPGPYNVLLYNHLGDEVFAEGLLTISSDVITPVFRDYDPKVIAEATEGFALLLTGESITADAAAHLVMRWFQGDRERTRLNSMFSPGGPGQMVCAVTGDLPAGKLQGRIFLDDKPIYLVEVTIQSPTGMLVGHAPTQLALDTVPYAVTILGADLTQNYVDPLEIELVSAETVAQAREVSLRDSSTLQAVFNGPLPQGNYELNVTRLGEVVYSGQIELTEQPTEPPESVESPEIAPVETPPAVEPPVEGSNQPPAIPPAEIRIDAVAPQAIPADAKAASLVINGTGLGAGVAERLQLRLAFGDSACELLFIGASGQNLTCLFAPPEGGWPVAGEGVLTITDPRGELAEYTAALAVTPATGAVQPAVDEGQVAPSPEAGLPVPAAATQAAPVSWDVIEASAGEQAGGGKLEVIMRTAASDWDPQLLSGSYTLLPDEPMLQQVFSNISLAGELTFRREDPQTAIGSCSGHFVPGDLLVELQYGPSAVSASMLALSAPQPTGIGGAPSAHALSLDVISGRLSPATVDWRVDFAPLTIREPGLVSLVFEPTPADPETAAILQADGSAVNISLDSTAWHGLLSAGQQLNVRLTSQLQLALAGNTEIQLPVMAGGETGAAAANIEFAKTTANVLDDEIEVLLLVPIEQVTAEQLENVNIDSSNLLLALNANEFSIAAEPAPELGGDVWQLRLIRDPSVLTDVSYGLLIDELLDSQDVELRLSWPELGQELAGRIRFDRTAVSSSADPAAEADADEGEQ
jgi:hypothetical protein